MTFDELEFSIAQYADGTLSAAEAVALEAVLARDAAASALLAEYRALDAGLKASPAPTVAWDQLAARISGAVSAGAATPPFSDEDEAALAQYADGTLAGDERLAVEARLADSAPARLLLNDYASLDRLLKNVERPSIDWDRLAGIISAAVGRQAGAGLPEDVEFAVAQYADGTLAPAQYAEVEARLADEPAARVALADYERIGAVAKAADPMPAVNWDRLAEHLSMVVAQADAAPDVADARPTSFPIFGRLRSPVRLAAAASVLLAVGVGTWVARQGGHPMVAPPPPPPGAIAVNVLISAPPAGATGDIDVSIGAPPTFAELPEDDLVTRPSRSMVSNGTVAERDGGFLAY